MCGLAGVVDFTGALVDGRALVEAGIGAIRHRGPDSQAVWCSGPANLGHARLSIIDLSSAADQPMIDDSGQVAVVYNGELYNFQELRAELRGTGRVFRTASDTEVLLQAYLHWGMDALERLSGMFAFALWDGRRGSLLLARDRLGIKPLYVAEMGGRLYFASEVKAILAMRTGRGWKIGSQGLSSYLWFGNALGADTLYAQIGRLLPGESMTFDAAGSHRKRFWDVANVPAVRDDFPTATRRVRELLDAAVASHLVSDVPVGIMLSGGIDSSAIATLAARRSATRLRTYSVAFDFDDPTELPAAERLAHALGTEHEELRVFARDVPSLLDELVRCHDEPFADAANIPLFLATRALRGDVKVVLQGDGGDELFAGYRRYELLDRPWPWKLLRGLSRALVPTPLLVTDFMRRSIRMVEALGAPAPLNFALLLTMDSQRHDPLQILTESARQSISAVDPFARYREVLRSLPEMDDVQKMLRIDTSILLPDTFLEKVDKSTMANSVEVRVPFLDRDLVEYALGLPAEFKAHRGERKRVLRHALRGLVPDAVLDGAKKGFGVPYAKWLRGPLLQPLICGAQGSRAVREGVLDGVRIERLAREHAAGRTEHGFLLWKAFQFMAWFEHYPVSL